MFATPFTFLLTQRLYIIDNLKQSEFYDITIKKLAIFRTIIAFSLAFLHEVGGIFFPQK